MHPACTLEYVWNVMSYAICVSFKQHSMAHKPTWKAPALVVAHHEDPQNTFWALHFGRVCTGNIVMRHQKVVLFSQCPPKATGRLHTSTRNAHRNPSTPALFTSQVGQRCHFPLNYSHIWSPTHVGSLGGFVPRLVVVLVAASWRMVTQKMVNIW